MANVNEDDYAVTIFLAYLTHRLDWYIEHMSITRKEAAAALSIEDPEAARLYLTRACNWSILEEDICKFAGAMQYALDRRSYKRGDIIDLMADFARSNDMEAARFLMQILDYENDYNDGEDDADRVQVLPEVSAV